MKYTQKKNQQSEVEISDFCYVQYGWTNMFVL